MEKQLTHRTARIIKDSIKQLNVDLKGLTVLTEAGTNFYLFTPVIAALAGAEKVYAMIKDSNYGKAEDIKKDVEKISTMLGVSDKISFILNQEPLEEIKRSDIITNSGSLRPFDSTMLSQMKKNAVIPIMYEAWELRNGEIDLEYCDKNKIKVGGTWENHPSIKVFDTTGMLAVKLSLEAGYEVIHNNILVWSDDEFGEMSAKAFKNAGANSVIITLDPEKLYKNAGKLDFIYICNYKENRSYWNDENSIFDIEKLLELNDHIGFVHLYGKVDYQFSVERGFKVFPEQEGKEMYMTRTLVHLGPLPVVRLQVAGYKVGQEMITENYSDLTQKMFSWM